MKQLHYMESNLITNIVYLSSLIVDFLCYMNSISLLACMQSPHFIYHTWRKVIPDLRIYHSEYTTRALQSFAEYTKYSPINI